MTRAYIIVLLAGTVLVAQDRPGFIHGTVTDIHGYVIPGAQVEVSSREQKCEMTSNVEGKFNCQLSPGRYSVRANGYSFFPYRRATINLNASAHVFVTLRTVPGPARGLGVDETGAHELIIIDPASSVNYEEQVVGGDDVLVRYHASEKTEGQIAFHGPYLMLTMDTLALYADEMTCTNPIRACTATGSVIAELGQEQMEGTSAELDLLSRKLVLTRNAKVERIF